MIKKIFGIDCSSYSIGCAIMNKKSIIPIIIEGGRMNSFDTRAEIMFHEFSKVLKEFKPNAVFVEGAIYLKNIKTTLMIARVINFVLASCIENNVYYQIVDNKSWKKDILGNGAATKEQIMEFAKAKWGNIFKDNFDLSDSACIAFYGWRRMNNG